MPRDTFGEEADRILAAADKLVSGIVQREIAKVDRELVVTQLALRDATRNYEEAMARIRLLEKERWIRHARARFADYRGRLERMRAALEAAGVHPRAIYEIERNRTPPEWVQ